MAKNPITPPLLSEEFDNIINNKPCQVGQASRTNDISKKNVGWQHFTFICDKSIVRQIHCIARREGFSIRELLESILSRSIESYIKKNGEIKDREKSVSDLF